MTEEGKKRKIKKKYHEIIDFMMIQNHFFKELLVWMNEMEDVRYQSYIQYQQSDYIFMGILKNVCAIESMCQIEENFNEEECINTLRILSGNNLLWEERKAKVTLQIQKEREDI